MTLSPIVTIEQYEMPTKMPNALQLFEDMARYWASTSFAEEAELWSLFAAIPKEPSLAPGRLPFFLVPGYPEIPDWKKLMGFVRAGGKTGVSYLNGGEHTNLVELPKRPYLMIDVEDGRSYLKVSQDDAASRIRAAGRSGFTTFESWAYATIFPVLERQSLFSVESLLDGEFVPTLYRNQEIGPTLGGLRSGFAVSTYGTPSCRERREC
ncbi:MAG: DUF5701 family protein [Patescibacteria group bacterium]